MLDCSVSSTGATGLIGVSLELPGHTSPHRAIGRIYPDSCKAQKVTPLPLALSQSTAGWKDRYSTTVEHQEEIRQFFLSWKLNRPILLPCFSFCCCFHFIRVLVSVFRTQLTRRKNLQLDIFHFLKYAG